MLLLFSPIARDSFGSALAMSVSPTASWPTSDPDRSTARLCDCFNGPFAQTPLRDLRHPLVMRGLILAVWDTAAPLDGFDDRRAYSIADGLVDVPPQRKARHPSRICQGYGADRISASNRRSRRMAPRLDPRAPGSLPARPQLQPCGHQSSVSSTVRLIVAWPLPHRGAIIAASS